MSDRRMRALSEAIAEFEAESGEITQEEMAAQRRADAESAVVVTGPTQGRICRASRKLAGDTSC